MGVSTRRWSNWGTRLALALTLPLAAFGCGESDDKDPVQPVPEKTETFPPALGPEDCVPAVTDLTLSQPAGADVWGGLTVLEFNALNATGALLDNFHVQRFDPAADAWLNGYVGNYYSGQREDGTYFLAVGFVPNDSSKDEQFRLRVRPVQQGCPEAMWTESKAFTMGNPIEGTSWSTQVPAALVNGSLNVVRTVGPLLPMEQVPLRVGDVGATLTFAKGGAFTQLITVPLESEKGAAYDGCTLALTFEGTWELSLKAQNGQMSVFVSQLALSSTEGTVCAFPKLADMALSGTDFAMSWEGFAQNVSVDYTASLYADPGAPAWSYTNFLQILVSLGQLLHYNSVTEVGVGQGGVYFSQATFEKEKD